jgi:hypothetical protein
MANPRNDELNQVDGVSAASESPNAQPDLAVASANGFSLLNTPFILAIRQAFQSGKIAFSTVITNGGGDLSDFWDTFVRLLQVAGNVVENGTNDASTENENSPYYKWFYQNGPGSNFTATGAAVFGVGGFIFVAGTAINIFKRYRSIVLGTYDYLLNQLNKLSTKEFARKDIVDGINDLIARGKVVSQLQPPAQRGPVPQSQGIQSVTDFINAFDSKKNAFKKYHNVEPSVGEKILGTFTLVVKKIHNFISNTAFVYWVIWFPFVLAVGIAAASSSFLWGPVVLAATFGVMTAFTLWKASNRIQKASLTPEQSRDRAESKKTAAEEQRMLHEAKSRLFIKQDHKAKKAILSAVISETDNRLAALKIQLDRDGKSDRSKKFVDESSQKRIALLRDKLYASAPQATVQNQTEIKTTPEDVRKSRLGKYLLAGVKRRAAVNVFLEAVSGIITVSFMFWIVSTVAAFIPGAIAKAIAVFCDSGFNTAIGGGILGGLLGIRRIGELVAEHKAYRQQVEETLTRRYKNTDQSVLEKYESLEAEVEFRKTRVQFLRLQNLLNMATQNEATKTKKQVLDAKIALQKVRSVYESVQPEIERFEQYKNDRQKLTRQIVIMQKVLARAGIDVPEQQLISQYDVNSKRNVNNHYYFAKQKESPSFGTRCKKLLNRAYTAVCGMQSGVFIARTLFLSGAILAGICVGAPPLFFAIAGALALTLAITRFARFYSERARAKRMAVLNSVDARISFMRKQNKELLACEKILNPDYVEPSVVQQPAKQVAPISNVSNEVVIDVYSDGEAIKTHLSSASPTAASAPFRLFNASQPTDNSIPASTYQPVIVGAYNG